MHITREDGRKFTIKPKHYETAQHVQFKYISIKQIKKLMRKKAGELFAVRVTPQLKVLHVAPAYTDIINEYKDIFLDELPDKLPPLRDVNFDINLKPDEPPPVRPVIRLSTDDLNELKYQLQLLLSKGLLRSSSSPYGAPVFFVKKKNGDLRMVCDYRALNKITIRDANPLPLVNEALDQVSGAVVFSKST
eukprot:IDg3840t1